MNLFKKSLALLMCTVIITLTVNTSVQRAQAEAITVTLTSLATAAGGAAQVLIPVLLAVGVAYAGYKIAKNRDAILGTFKKWIDTASTKVKSWINNTASSIEDGVITDGDTITIPREVLEEAGIFVDTYFKSYSGSGSVTLLDSEIIHINTLAEYIEHPALKEGVKNLATATKGPVIIMRNLDTGDESIYFDAKSVFDGFVLDNYNVLRAIPIISNSFFEGNNPLNGKYANYVKFHGYGNKPANTYYEMNQIGDWALASGTTIAIENGWIVGHADWRWIGKVIMPKNSYLIYSEIGNNDIPLVLGQNATIVASPELVGDRSNPLVEEDSYVYTPDYVKDNEETDVVPVVLTPDVLGNWHDYIINNTATERDVISILNPTGVKEVDPQEGWLEKITNGLLNIPNILKGIFEWLFVPSEVFLEDIVAGAQETMDRHASILTYPLTLVIRFLTAVLELDKHDCIIEIPQIGYKSYILYQGSSFNFSAFIRDNGYVYIQNIIYALGNFIMILGMLNMAKRKGDEIIRGV